MELSDPVLLKTQDCEGSKTKHSDNALVNRQQQQCGDLLVHTQSTGRSTFHFALQSAAEQHPQSHVQRDMYGSTVSPHSRL
eukprot:scaffold21872_cov122-Skeletonema_marinoi.AAC.3